MPPWRAIAIAIRDSVTVSIALDTSGSRSEIPRVSREVVSTSLGITSVSPGSSSTSSYVSPSGANAGSSPSASEEVMSSCLPASAGRAGGGVSLVGAPACEPVLHA